MSFIVRVKDRRLFLGEHLDPQLRRQAQEAGTRSDSRYFWTSREDAQVFGTERTAIQAKTEAGQYYPHLSKDMVVERQSSQTS